MYSPSALAAHEHPTPPPSRREPRRAPLAAAVAQDASSPSDPSPAGAISRPGRPSRSPASLTSYEQLSGIHIIRDAALSNVPLVTINVTA
ncbi:MAG: hypothetical protein WDO13_12645 [Verrucomicrobiota bacterium]